MIEHSTVPFLDPSTLKPSLNPILVTDGSGLEKVRQYLSEPRPFVLDYETNLSDTFYRRRVRTIQLGDRNVQFIIDLLPFAGSSLDLILGQGGYRRPGATTKAWWELRTGLEDRLADAHYAIHPIRPEVLEPVVEILRPSFESNSHLKIGHNLEFEYIVGKWCLGLRTWHLWDTMVAERLLLNGLVPNMTAGYFALDDVVRKYCGFQIDKEAQTSFDLETPLTEKQIIYCALDIRLPWAVKSAQEVKINKAQLGWTAQTEFNDIPGFGDMHLNGLYVNPEKWQKIIDANQEALTLAVKRMDSFFVPVVGRKRAPDPERTAELRNAWEALAEKSYDEVVLSNQIKAARKDPELTARLKHERQTLELERAERRAVAKQAYQDEKRYTTKKYTDEYDKMEGEAEINYNSSDQIRDALLAGSFGLTEKNLPDTSDPTLEKFADLPVVEAIRDYRGYKKALGTYGDRWIVTSEQNCTLGRPKPGFVDPDTGRIHSRFLQLGTDTGRPSSTNPNVLNLPQDKRIRESFEARAGYDLVTKDCAGQELVILTEYSGEPTWVAAFNAKQDIHSVSTSIIVPELWKAAAIHEETTMVVDGVVTKIPRCAFYYKNKEKCKCPKHVEYRNRYKAATLGLIMGKEAYSLGVELHISTEQSQAIIDQWMNAFKKNKQAIQYNQDICYDKGEARTLGGRRRIMRPVTYEQAKKAALEKYGQSVTQQQINITMAKMVKAVKREGGNVCYQGCLPGDTLILDKEKGVTPISTLCGRPIKVWDGKQYSSAFVAFSGLKRKVRIHLAGRKIVECSEEHKFLVTGTRGTLSWKTPLEFTRQTWIKHNENYSEWGSESMKFPPSYTARSSNGLGVRIENISDPSLLGEFVGRIASDGTISVNKQVTLLVAEHELPVLARLKEGIQYLFPDRWQERVMTKKKRTLKGLDYKSIYYLSLTDSEFANQLWLAGVKHKVPDFILQSSKMLCGYLRGMFDGDGCVFRDGIRLTFGQSGKKGSWAVEVQRCLSILGIRSNLHRDSNAVVVRVVKRDCKKFRDRVGFINPVKRSRLDALCDELDAKAVRLDREAGSAVVVKGVEITDEYVEMFDVVNSETEQFMADGLITHNSAADLMKTAMGCGFDQDGKPFLWHILEPQYGALIENYVYDEFVVESPEEHSEKVSELVSDAIIRAGAMYVKKAPMKSDGGIAKVWRK